MFCPTCAAQNADDAKFCRGCGANISLIPQVLTGRLAERLHTDESDTRPSRRRRHRGEDRPVNIERAVKSFFMGLAFIFVALAVMRFAPGGRVWWFWMLIPAFALMGDGVATYLRLKQKEGRPSVPESAAPQTHERMPPAPAHAVLHARDTGEIIAPPPSVTEGTTRHLNVPVERKRGEG